jgi:hypothetical protein
MRNFPKENYVIFKNQGADGQGVAFKVEEFEKLTFALDTSSSAAMTIKALISTQETEPDWSASQSATNQYSYARITSLGTGTTVAGATGIVLSGTDVHDTYTVELGSGAVRWINFDLSGYSAGQIDELALFPVNNTLR